MAEKILVIDDDRLVRKTIEVALKKADYQVVLAEDGDQAISELKRQMFDLVISDIRMPIKNGVEAVREIRALVNANVHADIPIIFVTGYADMSEELNAVEHGEIILKPFDLDQLLITVREYL